MRRLLPIRYALPLLALLTGTAAADAVVAARSRTTRDTMRAAAVEPIADMHVARMAHTATTLRDGRVLVAGGFTEERMASFSAEAFDPATERFLPLPRLHTLRHSHTATLLPDGKVLIVGGYTSGGRTLVESELFDPVTNRFTPTGALSAARAGHIAVSLTDGSVLIAGGVGPDWTFLASAERFDPATGRFAPTGAMTVARESHTAVRLHDGRVLIAGGHQGRRENIRLFASAETYDPIAGRFRRVGDMQIRRHKHDAALLRDGRVLVTGGSDERDDAGVYRSTEYFDPTTNSFVSGPALARPRYKHNGSAMLLPNGTLLLAGGAPQAETFDPRRGEFTAVSGADRLSGQFSAVALLRSGRVLITGGYGHNLGPQPSAWMFRP